MSDVKGKLLYLVIGFLVFAFGFWAGYTAHGVFDGSGVSRVDDYHQKIENELTSAVSQNSRIENGITSARIGIENSLERTAIIGSGISGIENSNIENTELLGRAERILQNAGERKQEIETK